MHACVCVCVRACVCVCVFRRERGLTFSKMLNYKHGPHYFPSPHPSLFLLLPPRLPRWSFFFLPWHNGDFNTNGIARNSSSWAMVNCICTKWASCFSRCHSEQQRRFDNNNEGMVHPAPFVSLFMLLPCGRLRHSLHLQIFPFHTRQLSRTERQKDKGIHLQQETFIKEGNTKEAE